MNRTVRILTNQISNERGDALALAMIILVVSIISSLVMIELTRQVEANSMRPRMKSMMAATEAKVREHLLSPTSYTSCDSTGRSSCQLPAGPIASLSRKVVGTPCPTGIPNCGIAVTLQGWSPMFTATTSRAHVRIHYEGTEWALKDIDVIMDIPADVLQSNGVYRCPDPLRPKFNGFNGDGTLNCGALPPDAGAGQYISNVNMVDLTTTIVSLPPTATCAANELVGHVDWGNGGSAFNFTCAARANPYTEFGFTPGSTAADPVYTPNSD